MKRGLLKRACVLFLGGGLLLGAVACLPVTAIFTADPIGGPPPLTVTFDASASYPMSVFGLYEWDFGDGTQGEGMIVDHTYTQLGEYRVRLICHSNQGSAYNGKTSRLVVCTAGPEVTLTAGPLTGDVPLRVRFDGSETTPPAEPRRSISFGGTGGERYVIDNLVWDYGDGTTETWENDLDPWSFWLFGASGTLISNHTYTAPGTYTATLTVTDVLGLTDSAEIQVVVGETDPEPDDDPAEDFTIVNNFWQITDEEDDPEQECLDIWGEVRNDGSVDAGCELTAIAYDALNNPVGSVKNWPADNTNIVAGATQPFSFFLCSLTVPANQVVRVEVTVSSAVVW